MYTLLLFVSCFLVQPLYLAGTSSAAGPLLPGEVNHPLRDAESVQTGQKRGTSFTLSPLSPDALTEVSVGGAGSGQTGERSGRLLAVPSGTTLPSPSPFMAARSGAGGAGAGSNVNVQEIIFHRDEKIRTALIKPFQVIQLSPRQEKFFILPRYMFDRSGLSKNLPAFEIKPLPEHLFHVSDLLSSVIYLKKHVDPQHFLRWLDTDIPGRRRGFIRLNLAAFSTIVFYPDGKIIDKLGFDTKITPRHPNLNKEQLKDLLIGIDEFIRKKRLHDSGQALRNTYEPRFDDTRVVEAMKSALTRKKFFPDRRLVPSGRTGLARAAFGCVRCKGMKRGSLVDLVNTKGDLYESDPRHGSAVFRSAMVACGLLVSLSALLVGFFAEQLFDSNMSQPAAPPANTTMPLQAPHMTGNGTMIEQQSCEGESGVDSVSLHNAMSKLLASSLISLTGYLYDTRFKKGRDKRRLGLTNACCDAFAQINNDIQIIAAVNRLLFAGGKVLSERVNRLKHSVFREHNLSSSEKTLNIAGLRTDVAPKEWRLC